MLSTITQISAKVSRRDRMVLASAAAIVLMMPTLYLSRSIGATPAKPGEGQPLRAVLPAGMIVDVLGMANHPSQGGPWWAPDGTPTATPYEKVNAEINGWKNELHREIAIRWIKRPSKDVTVYWGVNCSSGRGGTNGFDKNGNVIQDLGALAALFSASETTCTVRFQIAAGPWETIAQTDGGQFGAEGEEKYGFVFSKASERGGITAITISHNVIDRDMRIVAVVEGGKETAPDQLFSGSMKNIVQTDAEFSNLPLDGVQEFRLQARPYQIVEVRDIALNPGQATKPHLMVIDQPPDKAAGK
ncbi:MAG TPA: hypothetical protein VGZ26_01360 [Pirellulales bacterium]|nr:hypothetical protein [Pirellulales bacterium]